MLIFSALFACSLLTPESTPPVEWAGPKASLDDFCPQECTVYERRSLGDIEVVVFSQMSESVAELAIRHSAGWSALGQMALMPGRHSPMGVDFDLENATLDGTTLTVTRSSGGTSYAPGETVPASSWERTERLTCEIGDVVTCSTTEL